MVLTINLAPGVPSYRQRTVLDGREYILDLRWSQSEARWYLDIRTNGGDLLLGSIKLVVEFPLLRTWRGGVTGLPPGELVVVDGRPAPADPGLDELGDSHQLVYLDAETMAELEAA